MRVNSKTKVVAKKLHFVYGQKANYDHKVTKIESRLHSKWGGKTVINSGSSDLSFPKGDFKFKKKRLKYICN